MGEALRRRIMPATSLALVVENDDGSKFTVELRLSFNMNVLADIEEKCKWNLMINPIEWVDDPKAVRTVLWAAALPYQPEYRSDDGLEAIGEYMTLDNRVDTIEALFKAYSLFVRKDRRETYIKTTQSLVEVLRTGKAPEEVDKPTPLAATANLSVGPNSAQSPVTTLVSKTTTSSAA
jgi:hypothetical protein